MQASKLSLLVLHAHYQTRLSFFDDWLDAIRSFPSFATTVVDIVRSDAGRNIRKALDEVDAVVLLHSTNCDTTAYLDRWLGILAERRVPLLAFVGNEVNLPGSPIADKRRALSAIQPEWIATQLPLDAGKYLFADLASRAVVPIPHALNAAVFFPTAPVDERPIDIGARSARYLAHLGDDDRNRIHERFAEIDSARMVIDIANSRYDREGWMQFLNRCKAVIGTEAGSWFLERDDATVDAIRRYLSEKSSGLLISNDSRLRMISHRLPWSVRMFLRRLLKRGPIRLEAAANDTVEFSEIYEKFFKDRPKAPVYSKCISSRHFEAAGTKTCQIMFRGRFNDILEADRHYLAIDNDFANLESVLARFSDPTERNKLADAAYDHVMAAHRFDHRMRQINDLLYTA